MYIAFEGPIGAGKTTLTKLLAKNLGAQSVLEDFDGNPFLSDFYDEQDRWGLAMQLWFLADRYAQLSKVRSAIHSTVADHTLFKDRVFAQTLLSKRELSLYERISGAMHETIELPSVVVFLDARDDILLERIKRRDRSYERTITVAYLDSLRASYAQQFQSLPASVVHIDTSDLDLSSAKQIGQLFEKIVTTARNAQNITEAARAC